MADSASEDTPPSFSVSEGSYISLKTGKAITLVRDAEQGMYLYDTKRPVEDDFIFVETSTNDTLYGKTGVVVNGALKSAHGRFSLDESKVERVDGELRLKSPR